MSLKNNIIANYVSQLYATVIGIVMVPMYIRYMGAEAYGLVGFFAMLQTWFQMLDMGMTPTMTREAARFRAGAMDALALRLLLRSLEGVFIGIALLGAAGMFLGADRIAGEWLKVQHLPLEEVRNAVLLMGLVVALRWVSGLYRGAISGMEHIVWLSGFNIVIATTRFVLVFPFFIFVGVSPTDFFGFQLAVALVETLVLVLKTYQLLPVAKEKRRLPWQWSPLHRVIVFSLSIAFTNSVWVLVTQTDKLLLSKLLPLTDYAYFTLAVMVASGVLIISIPISGALLPRMTKLSAEGDNAGLISLYRNATQLVGVIAVPAALMLAFFSEEVLWVWTGDIDIARRAAPVLALYALGNGILTLAAFPYYLQFAKGDLKLHLAGNVLFVLTLIPALVWATWRHGVVGAGYVWLSANIIFFLFYVPVVHARFVKGLHIRWLTRDVSAIVLLTVIEVAAMRGFIKWPEERISAACVIALSSLMSLAIAAAASSCVRDAVIHRYRDRFRFFRLKMEEK